MRYPRTIGSTSAPALVLFLVSVGCSSPPAVTEGAKNSEVWDGADVSDDLTERADDTPTEEVSTPAADSADSADSADAGASLEPSNYCEVTADAFCDFYLRCGRMAAPDVASCKVAFLEGCNGVYEPLYVDLAARGLLALSAPGVDACVAHLANVSCDLQVFDLDGPCGQMWAGQASEGTACGPGLQSFVCEASTTCVLDLSFCGTCKPLAGPDQACDAELRCRPSEHCEQGECVPRVPPGAPCKAEVPCVLGTGCIEGTCTADAVVAVGESCGGTRRCPYKADCIEGLCVESALTGQACGSGVSCASGWCDGGTCVGPSPAGDTCTAGGECVSGSCGAQQQCTAITFGCL